MAWEGTEWKHGEKIEDIPEAVEDGRLKGYITEQSKAEHIITFTILNI